MGVDELLRDKNPKPPMDSDLFISRSRKRIEDLTDEDLQAIDSRVTKELLGDISIKTCVDARVSFGGTAPSEVRRQIEVGRQWLNSLER